MNYETVNVSGSRIKLDARQILAANGRLVNDTDGISCSDGVLVNSNDASKVLANQNILPVAQSLNFNTPLSLSNINAITSGATLVPTSQNNNLLNQPVQMFQSGSFDENILDQQSGSGQAFLLAPHGTVISSNHMVSQGQVFIQGDELVTVSLPNTYSVASSDSQYNAVSLMQSGSQNIASNRIILQQNQPGSTVSNPIIPTNNGQYLIQVKNPGPNISQNGNFSISNKGHIIIKSGGANAKGKSEQLDNAVSSKEGVYRVIIPKGTTKLPKATYPILQANDNDDFMKKHVQINLSNRATHFPIKNAQIETGIETTPSKPLVSNEDSKPPSTPGRKLYECNNCNNKFMKALYLRMHMRSCKKLEVKPEKTPLYMCSFCKSTFKTKPQINHHFTKCSHNPSNSRTFPEKTANDDVGMPPNKRSKVSAPIDVDLSLEQAVQYKCQDCDRTFNKERQYTSHIKRCTNVSVHDLSGIKAEQALENLQEEDHESPDDPFADPVPIHSPPARRGRGTGGRRGRPPGRIANAAQKSFPKSTTLFEGEPVVSSSSGLIVADNENLVRSTTGLAHTVQMSLESAIQEGQPQPSALISDFKGVRGREKPPQAWSLVCSLCQKMFLTKAALANHVIDNHGPDLRETRDILLWQSSQAKDLFRCPMCDLHYQSNQHFIEHLVMQHTNKLQECHRNLQAQTATFVCSMCSLVLLTKNLLLEHLSLEHLEELEKIKLTVIARKKRKRLENTDTVMAETTQPTPNYEEENRVDEPGNPFECRLCGENFDTQATMIAHYVSAHNVEVDDDGFILDLGVDVDIRVKDTKRLLQLADGKVDESSLPPKTVLIRKKPKQSWTCQNCMQVFTRNTFWLRHIRDICPMEKTLNNTKDSKFFCQFLECSQTYFYQFKSLVKHLEEVHNHEVKRVKQTYPSLSAFCNWLMQEEQTNKVRFVRDSARIEKHSVRLIQLVCHRFHSGKSDNDAMKPTKKRWFVRIQRECSCYARIHLRIELDEVTKQFEGETQVLYYSEHCHNGVEDAEQVLEDKYPIGRPLFNPPEPQPQTQHLSLQTSSSNDNIALLSEGSEIILPTGSTNGLYNSVSDTNKSLEEAFMVDEEYVLPADEGEWKKLFEVLTSRLESGELVETDQKEAQALLQYRNVISMVNLPEQVTIFHKMCALTNTPLESV